MEEEIIVIESDLEEEIPMMVENTIEIGGTQNHSELQNLDFEHSGHTGFASSEDLEDYTKTEDLGSLALKDSVNYNTEVTNKPTIPTKTSDLTNDSGFIDNTYHDSTKVDVVSGKGLSTNDYTTADKTKLTNIDTSIYSLITETGNKIDLSIDSSTYVVTLVLKDKNNNNLSTGTIDLPLETMVVNATYDNVNKKIILTLKNGNTIDVPVGDLVNGLASQSSLDAEITNRQNADNLKQDIMQYATLPTASSSLVGKIGQYVGTTTSDYTNGYFYKCVDTSTTESINVSQTDNGVSLGTINIDNNTFKSQVSAGTHEFVFRPYNTVLNFSNLNTFPPTMYQVTRDSLFDRQPMIAGAPKLYSWVDSANNYYATDTLEPNGLTKLYTLDVRTYDMTDTGATYVSSNTPSQIEGRWTKKEGDIYTNVDLEDYGITLTSMGIPGNTIRVVYTSANESYSWVNINVQDEGSIVSIDESSITKNSDDELQASGVIDSKTSGTDKFWTGTLAEYNAIATKDNNTFYNITDDEVNNGVPSGGSTNQVLKKNSATDYDYSWGTINIPTKISDLTNDLPTVEMVVTLDDDTTQTYTIYGEVE